MAEARKHPWEQYAENQRALLDKEETAEGVIIEGASDDASSDGGNRHMEKELEKAPGQVTVV